MAFFQYAVVTFVLGTGIVIVIIDQLMTTTITPFLITTTIVGTFYLIRPWAAGLIFALSFMVYFFGMVNFTNLSANVLGSNVVNGLVANAMGFALSTVTWQSFHRSKLQEERIAEQQARLEQMAYEDPLTQLPNRRLLDELVKREVALIRRGQGESCLIIFDIDNFKLVNDSYGHPVGDCVLKGFADLLKNCLCGGNNTLVRLGGEEFVILAASTPLEQAVSLAERLRKLVEEHEFHVEQFKIQITASFGVAPLLGTENSGDYYSDADQALYLAKQNGKNQVKVFQSERAS